MTKAIRFHKTGGPEVLQLDDVEVGRIDIALAEVEQHRVDRL